VWRVGGVWCFFQVVSGEEVDGVCELICAVERVLVDVAWMGVGDFLRYVRRGPFSLPFEWELTMTFVSSTYAVLVLMFRWRWGTDGARSTLLCWSS
jgi:hypothetical protein